MEKERWKRLFSTLSQRCINQPCAHIQNHGNDSYLLASEFKGAEVKELAINNTISLTFLFCATTNIAILPWCNRKKVCSLKGLVCFYFIQCPDWNKFKLTVMLFFSMWHFHLFLKILLLMWFISQYLQKAWQAKSQWAQQNNVVTQQKDLSPYRCFVWTAQHPLHADSFLPFP